METMPVVDSGALLPPEINGGVFNTLRTAAAMRCARVLLAAAGAVGALTACEPANESGGFDHTAAATAQQHGHDLPSFVRRSCLVLPDEAVTAMRARLDDQDTIRTRDEPSIRQQVEKSYVPAPGESEATTDQRKQQEVRRQTRQDIAHKSGVHLMDDRNIWPALRQTEQLPPAERFSAALDTANAYLETVGISVRLATEDEITQENIALAKYELHNEALTEADYPTILSTLHGIVGYISGRPQEYGEISGLRTVVLYKILEAKEDGTHGLAGKADIDGYHSSVNLVVHPDGDEVAEYLAHEEAHLFDDAGCGGPDGMYNDVQMVRYNNGVEYTDFDTDENEEQNIAYRTEHSMELGVDLDVAAEAYQTAVCKQKGTIAAALWKRFTALRTTLKNAVFPSEYAGVDVAEEKAETLMSIVYPDALAAAYGDASEAVKQDYALQLARIEYYNPDLAEYFLQAREHAEPPVIMGPYVSCANGMPVGTLVNVR